MDESHAAGWAGANGKENSFAGEDFGGLVATSPPWCGLMQKMEPGPACMSTAVGDNRYKTHERKLQLALRESGSAWGQAVQKGWEISILGDSHR